MQANEGRSVSDAKPGHSSTEDGARPEWPREREQMYRSLDAAGVAGWTLDVKNGLAFCSDRLKFLFGLPNDTPTWAPATVYVEAVNVEDRAMVQEQLSRSAETGVPFDVEFRVTGTDGRERWVVSRGTATVDEAGNPSELSGAIIEITERRSVEIALRLSEGRRRLALESAEVGTWNIDLKSFTLTTDKRFRTIFGAAGESLSFEEAFDLIHPGDRKRVEEAVTAACRPIDPLPYAIEYRVVHADGAVRWVAAMGQTNSKEGGTSAEADTFDGTIRDITNQKSTLEALKASEAKLRGLHAGLEDLVEQRTEELAAAVTEAESFNYSIAHDLRSPLRAISSTASILIEEAGPELGEIHRELLIRQHQNANRLGRLIDELLRLSRFSRVELKREPLDMSALALSVFAELADAHRTNACSIEVEPGMVADGDPSLVRTVVHNLIGNACKFSPDGGAVKVGKEGEAFFVRDDGVGFEIEYAPKIFKPFERLVSDAEFEGTGIGLANVERIVQRHLGRVWAVSAPGKGSTFYFTLGLCS